MQTTHKLLFEHFEELRHKRGERAVYFLEHGLDADDIENMVARVSSACAVNPISSPFWRNRYFPLLIVATEVGYTYRGTGTDFWPRFDVQLSTTTTQADRQALSALFRMASERHGGITPPDTPWARAFHHIAWPISHAVLPLEFHHLFAQSLAALQQHRMDPTRNDVLIQAIRDATRNRGSVRFATVLADRNLVLTLSRHFLRVSMEEQSLSSQVLNRISTDLRKDRDAARNIDLAYRQRRRADAEKTKPGIPEPKPAESQLIGTLYLRKQDSSDEMLLEAILPKLAPDLVIQARKDLRRRRFSPQLWGVSSRIPSDQLLSGLPFRIGRVESLSDLSDPMLPDVGTLQVAPEVRAQLERFTFDLSTPLLFQERKDESVAAQVRGSVARIDKIYWLLTSKEVETSNGVQLLGTLGNMKCVRVDPSLDSGEALLRREDVEIRYGTLVKWVGDPPKHIDATVLEYREGDTIAMQVGRVPPEGVIMNSVEGTEQITLATDGLVSLINRLGMHHVQLKSEGRTQQFDYSVSKRSSHQELCWVSLEGEEPSVQALLGRAFAIRVDGISPITGLRLNVSLVSGNVSVMCSKFLSPLPSVIGPKDPIWNRLLSDRIRDILGTQQNIRLRVVVGGLTDAEWNLESRVRPCWWEGDDEDRRLMSEEGELPYGSVSSGNPTADPEATIFYDRDGTLLLPMPANSDQLDPIAEFSSLFITPDSLNIRLPLLNFPKLLRARNSNNYGIGTEQLITAMFRWGLADTVGLVADLRRRQITLELEKLVVRVICGDNWADIENIILERLCSPWECLVGCCLEANVGYDSYIELNQAEETRLGQIAIQQLQATVPDLWVDPLGTERSGDTYDALDTAFAHAYELLASELKKEGRIDRAELAEQGDPGSAPSQWDEVLFTAQSLAELQDLVDLVYPTTGGDELASLDYGLMNLENLLDEIDEWVRRHNGALQGRRWSRDELEAALCLWLDPEKALRTPWRTATERFITDRWTSRAVRYVALRRRISLEAYANVRVDR